MVHSEVRCGSHIYKKKENTFFEDRNCTQFNIIYHKSDKYIFDKEGR